jgi:antitoxin (DNA-binding transcriptional repressor) of toxin-antitoxin stability system
MRTYTVGEFKSHFSEILEYIRAGEQIAIAFGRKKEVVAILGPPSEMQRKQRPLGLLAGKAQVKFEADFKITEEEFLGP